ncbi:MAG: hypothetical protein NPIRA02_19670 [Nitrospirales bacterium]|nr:MAG: hypothetical protein NPIRA02_19670 [Nitrospirales bacterium]
MAGGISPPSLSFLAYLAYIFLSAFPRIFFSSIANPNTFQTGKYDELCAVQPERKEGYARLDDLQVIDASITMG